MQQSELALDIRKDMLCAGILKGKPGHEAAANAGYGTLAQKTPWKLIPPDEMRARFQAIAERKGLTLDKIGEKIEQHLEARMTQTLQGKEVTLSDAPDYRVQQKAVDQLTTLLGMQDAAKAVAGGSSISLTISGPAAERLAAMLGG
jgi:xanthine dehydrogenase iron-sulfur cluster and FAD-binding subunit A